MSKIDLHELKEISNSLYGYVSSLSFMERLESQDESIDGITRLADRLALLVGDLIDDKQNDANTGLFSYDVLFLGDKCKLQAKIDPIYNIDYLPLDQLDNLNKILEGKVYQIVLIEQNSLISNIDLSNLNTENICFLSMHESDQSNVIKHQIFTEYLGFDILNTNFNELISETWNAFTKNRYLMKLELGQSLSVMSVEDDLDSRNALNSLFILYGFNTTNCSTASEAISLITSESYDIIILDLGLKDHSGDGTELALRMRQIQKMKRDLLCPILINTGRANDMKEEYRLYGITEYHQKPFLTKELGNVLRRYLPDSCF